MRVVMRAISQRPTQSSTAAASAASKGRRRRRRVSILTVIEALSAPQGAEDGRTGAGKEKGRWRPISLLSIGCSRWAPRWTPTGVIQRRSATRSEEGRGGKGGGSGGKSRGAP